MMRALPSYFVLLVALACPALCKLGLSSVTAASKHPHEAARCDCCPGERESPPEQPPKPCLCSPFVMHEQHASVSLSMIELPMAAVLTSLATLPEGEPGRVARPVGSESPPAAADGVPTLPLLI